MKAGRLLCCKSKVLRVSTGLLSRAAASQVLRSSGLRGCFVGARQEANSPPALLCPPQATLRADHLLLWDKKQTTNSSRTASGKWEVHEARDVVSWSSFFSARLRALGPGGKSPPQAPLSSPQAPLSEIRRAERPSPLTKWPQIRLHARHGRDIEGPEVAVLRRGDGAEPRSEKCEIITSASDQTAC